MPVTFQVVGNLADFSNDARPNVKVRATATPRIKVSESAVHSNQPETVVTDADGAFTLELVSLPGVWYRIQTPYGNQINTVNLAGYVPDEADPTTGEAFPADTVINLADVVSEDPTPGFEAVAFSTPATWAALPDKPALGTAATTDATAYATSTQGAKADTAVQPATLTAAVNTQAARVAAFDPLRATLSSAGRSSALQILGDSTGDGTTEWVYTLGQAIATAYPQWTVKHRLWDDATQDYAAPTVLQTGTAGQLAMVVASGSQTRRLSASASPHIAGAIDVRLKMSLSDWTPTAQHVFTGKYDVAGSRGWYVGINNTASGNRPIFAYSTDGTAVGTMTVVGTPTVTDGATIWMRWVFTPDNGAGSRTLSAYQSTDGVTWTQIGATTTTAGAVTVNNNSAIGYSLGGEASGANATGATIYEVEIRDGVAGPSVVPAMPDLWPPNSLLTANAIPVTGAPVLTLLNGSKSGANIAYWADATRLKKATPNHGQATTLLSLSHNQGVTFGAPFVSEYETWRQQVETRLPGVPSVVLTQNPETAASVNAPANAQRRRDLLGLARQKGVGVVDTYQAIESVSGWADSLMADSIHPNAAGSDVWRDSVLRAAGL